MRFSRRTIVASRHRSRDHHRGTATAKCTSAFAPIDVEQLREGDDGVVVIAHPECPPECRLRPSDFAGSTGAMIDYVRGESADKRIVMLTECSMSDNVAGQNSPTCEFVRPCNLCPHMKRITLGNIRHSLETLTHEVVIDPAVAIRARRAVERMLAVK